MSLSYADFYKAKSVTLILTNQCNLRCSYCYESEKNNKTMSIELAKKIIYKEMTKDDNYSHVVIDLFGGEPLLEFETIKQIVQFLSESNFNKKYICFAGTNGTLVHGNIKNWLKKNAQCFQLGLSLDGTRECHNRNRSNSFDDIDIDFFVKTYPGQGIKMTISQESLQKLSECVIFGHECGFNDVSCNLAFGIDWSDKSNEEILNRELHLLIDYYLANPHITPCSMLDMEIQGCAFKNDSSITRKWCGAGTHMFMYDVNGSCYPCQFFTPLSCGEERAQKAKKLKFLNEIPIELLDEKCRNCPIEMVCPTCYGSNYVSTGNIYLKDDNLCKLTKIIIKARSYFKAKQWEKGFLKLDKDNEQLLLRSIIKIQEIN